MRDRVFVPLITADWLLARVVDRDGCLVWAGYSQDGNPKANFRGPNGDRPHNVRRLVWKAMTGRTPRSDRIYVACCGTENCVDPAHIVERDHGARNRGRVQTIAARAAMAQALRAKSHLTQEAIADMRKCEKTQDEYADQYGVCQTMVSLIQLRKKWIDYEANPFVQLMGAR